MERCFYLDESPIYQNKFIIRLDLDKFLFPHGTEGSYNVFPARVLNLSYADYLRYCRDRLGAELVGRNNKYVVAYFDRNKESEALIKLLNKRMEYILLEQELPYDYVKKEDGTIERIPFNIDEDNDRTTKEV